MTMATEARVEHPSTGRLEKKRRRRRRRQNPTHANGTTRPIITMVILPLF